MADIKITDVLGLKSVGDIGLEVVKGVGGLLGKVLNPAADEAGVRLAQKVRNWQSGNVVKVVECADRKVAGVDVQGLSAPPRIVAGILDRGSWVDDPDLQELWGGLLASSFTEDGMDDSNLLVLDLLSGLTCVQARLLKYACERAQKFLTPALLPMAFPLPLSLEGLFDAAGIRDIERLDRELDRLRVVGLLDAYSGLNGSDTPPHGALTPSALGLRFYVRCQGSRSSPTEYFGIVMSCRLVGGASISSGEGLWVPVEANPPVPEGAPIVDSDG